ncbi:uncharacterized protein LOC143230284 isoform X1 [Tachypleus tridentatus]|uniref:uncharacterized protein LOC143230284 isoform X1 n=1 Tax=Tachypleus tridentatus TaxID=6853 RepID=UPI003FD5A1AE
MELEKLNARYPWRRHLYKTKNQISCVVWNFVRRKKIQNLLSINLDIIADSATLVNQGHHLEKQDVEAVVDGICQENLLEVDITHFLQMICGHVKDFKVTMSLEETCKSFEKSSNKIVLEQDIHKKDGDASMIPEGERWNIMMWLEV